ncbi:MAG: ABC transporter permease [Bacteroidales bacterium]|nr:ABC transporter permease [Bacteroidales bacterium]
MKLFKMKHILTVPSLLNIGGIAIAVAAFYVIMSVVDYHLTFNKDIEGYENIYQLSMISSNGQRDNSLPRRLGETIGQQIPSITQYGCLHPWAGWALYAKQNNEYHKIETRIGSISNGLLQTFGFKIVEGDTSRFDNMDKLIISRDIASKFNLHVGDFLKTDLNTNEEAEVVAIYENFENNSELHTFNGLRCLGDHDILDTGWGIYTFYYKATIDPTETMLTSKDVVLNIVKTAYPEAGITDEAAEMVMAEVAKWDFKFIPLHQLHFEPEMKGHQERTDKMVVYTLLILAIVIVVIAYINYLNFFMARIPQRIKSINTMKILGSSRNSLVTMLICESIIYTAISIAIASVLVLTVAPSILDGVVDMAIVLYNYKILAITIVAAIAIAVAVSIYPALRITNMPPALALKGSVTQDKDSALRYILIGFQIAASTVLIIVALFIHQNTEYLSNHYLGFNSKNLLGVETSKRISANRETVRNRLLQNTDIVDIAWTKSELIARQRFNVGFLLPSVSDQTLYCDIIFSSDNFLDFMDIKITDGRNFSPSDHKAEKGVYIFNETARKKYNLTTEIQFPSSKGSELCDIVGFCSDFNFKPLHYAITPLAFHIPGKNTPDYMQLLQLYIRIADGANVKKAIDFVETTLAEVDPDFPTMNHEVKTFQNEVMSSNYADEERITSLITIFAFVAILISVMGIFGIVFFETERRRKEIGIRKVNGATVLEILSMFNRKFLILTGICSAIAIPLAFIIVNAYFGNFAYHYDINIWMFLFGIAIAVFITAAVVTGASYRAANENPINTLKSE